MIEDRIISGEALTAYLAAKPYLAMENIPYADDVVGKYAVPGWGALSKQIEDPLTPPESISQLRQDRAKLFMSAVHHSDVHLGPVREREEVAPEPSPNPDENPNEWRIVKAMKKMGGNLKQHWNNSTSFFKENKGKASASLLVGALAGMGIVTGVHVGTEFIMNGLHTIGLSHPGLDWLIGASINVGGSWAINQKLFLDRVVRKWVPKYTDASFRRENDMSSVEALSEEQQKKIDLDTNGIISSVVIGDIEGKLLAAILPIDAMIHRIRDGVHAFNEWAQSQGNGGAVPTAEYNVPVTPEPAQVEIPPVDDGLVDPATGEPIETPSGTGLPGGDVENPDLSGSASGIEHIVQGNNEMLTKILVEHGLKPYSGDYIRLLTENKDVFVEMLKKTYPNGNVPVLENLTSNKWDYISVDQAVKNLNEVIQAGYPDPSKLTESALRAALTKMFNAIRYLPSGTEIEMPTP